MQNKAQPQPIVGLKQLLFIF